MNPAELGKRLAHETLKFCEKEGPTCSLESIYSYLQEKVVPTINDIDDYRDSYENHTDPKWMTVLKFQLIAFDKAGWFKKSFPKRGYWTITEEGKKALQTYNDAESLARAAGVKYNEWKKSQKDKLELGVNVNDFISSTDAGSAVSSADDISDAADLEIKEHLKKMDPYDFQNLVAALFVAMGYFVDFIAQKGKDGGIDLVCYQDPLGIKIPRMKVQIKRHPDGLISRPMLSEFAGVINSKDEVGIYVTSGTYSRDARSYAIAHEKHIRLIDGTELIELCKTHYDKLSDVAVELLPLIKVFHVKAK